MATFETALKSRLVYVFTIPDEWHAGCLKVGETTLEDDGGDLPLPNSAALNKAARARIDSYTKTAGVPYDLLHTEMTVYFKDGRIHSFNDRQVHAVLERSGVRKKVFDTVRGANEWYCCDLATARRAIAAVKEGRESLAPGGAEPAEAAAVIFRPEQLEAIAKTERHFRKGSRMLWNAKMRFGKTLCALRVARDMEMRRTIILTHRPVVNESWYEDFNKIFAGRPGWHYGSRAKGERFATLEALAARGDRYVYFASMQDMRGAQLVGGKFDKNNEVFAARWDFLIVDEAHEGTQTDLGRAVIGELSQGGAKVLRLSGTPFNLLDDHSEDETYTWDYTMEQRAKSEWDLLHMGDANPYAGLPSISVYTYDLGELMTEYAEDERAFNFREFFRTGDDGAFAHGDDVDAFLSLLCKDDGESLYPYANERFRSIFRHTLWVVPGVKAARALAAKLRSHPVFGLFTVVNVAGDGDEDEESPDALRAVSEAIGPHPGATHTITLSCGRLTTGVSVRPWTAVFIMAGAFSTSAAGYMQTIFRVQTPFECDGRVKERCYAFDFAPDRTLRILAEAAKTSAKASRSAPGGDRAALGGFLNFCPVIAVEGSRMRPYDVNKMMAQLKRAQIERVVRRGFEDGALYSDALLRLTDGELRDFEKLRGVIGRTKAIPLPAGIGINRQGLTGEARGEEARLAAVPKGKRTPEEEARLAELRKRHAQRGEAMAILRGISIRMPLLIFGAELADEEEGLTLDRFTDAVDDASWAEFMPRGVTKRVFAKFRRYYEPDVFREAGKRIRAMVRAADSFTVEERVARMAEIFGTFRNPDKETVLTPWRVVNMHLSGTLGGWCFWNEDFTHPLATPRFVDRGAVTREAFGTEAAVMDINSKSGLYPLLAAYNIYRRRVEEVREKYGEPGRAFSMQLWDWTVERNILALCKTPMARGVTRRTLAGFRDTAVRAECYKNLRGGLARNPALVAKRLRDGKRFWGTNNGTNMKIDAVIGNPPYQEEGASTRKAPIYHLFCDLAFRLSDRVTLITPGRFLFKAGQTPKEWTERMLADRHLKVAEYFQRSEEVFPTVDIKGGVAITFRDAGEDFGPIGFFSEHAELKSILRKVTGHAGFKENEFAKLVSPRGMYRFSENFFNDHPEAREALGSGTGNMVTSNAFELYPDAFAAEKPEEPSGYVKMFGRVNSRRVFRWVRRDYLLPNGYLGAYNVLVPEANGTGAIGEVLSTPIIGTPIIGTPIIGTTDTFLSVGIFSGRREAERCLKYVKTKFARTLLGTLKATQHNPRETWANVPMQDFTDGSDIDWERPVTEIDRQLYAKYGLTEGEARFVERMIKPME